MTSEEVRRVESSHNILEKAGFEVVNIHDWVSFFTGKLEVLSRTGVLKCLDHTTPREVVGIVTRVSIFTGDHPYITEMIIVVKIQTIVPKHRSISNPFPV